MELGLEGKVVLVTGGTDGLGLALARTLVAEGARVAVCGRDEERLEAAADALREAASVGTDTGESDDDGGDDHDDGDGPRAAGGGALVVRADVTDMEDLRRLMDAVTDRWGRLDGLVNGAGRSAAKPVALVEDEEWAADLDLKLFAAVRLIRLALPFLRVRGGSIVNVLAIGGRTPGAASAPSSVSRAAGLALTKALSREVGGDVIRVNAVLIGLIESGQWEREANQAGGPTDELYRTMAEQNDIPLGRVGRGEEFADLAAYLLSDRASYVTGTAINLDGGLSPVA